MSGEAEVGIVRSSVICTLNACDAFIQTEKKILLFFFFKKKAFLRRKKNAPYFLIIFEMVLSRVKMNGNREK